MSGAAPPVHLRPLVRADLPALVRLERVLFGASAWSPAMLAEELDAPERWYIGADVPEEDAAPADRLAGYAGLWFDGDDAHVMTIGVAPAQQGHGVGGVLMAALVDRALEIRARSLLLEVRVDNAPALALYERFGFAALGRRRGYYQPENVDAWIMRRELAAEPPSAGDASASDAPAADDDQQASTKGRT